MTCGRFRAVLNGGLMPLDDGAKEIVRDAGETVQVEVLYERDAIYHRRVFATMGDLARAIGQEPEWLRAQLLIYVGLCHLVGTHDDKEVFAVSSMSRSSMRDDELHAFWDDAKAHIVQRILPLVKNDTTRERLHIAVEAF